ncbi:secreted antigen 1 [Babesia caballi]|uniref:Secreted antigen 1 n=1 Tax=Babesia caballi TaxID=5871 RepID=A0AAV4M2E0_BABCB|nr:secreted antigen 1 [Babesia caballi]
MVKDSDGFCNGRIFTETETLKDALDYLAALNGNDTLVEQISIKLEQKATKYFKEGTLTNRGYSIKECLTQVLEAARKTRETIVSAEMKNNYGIYAAFLNNQYCVEPHVDVILNLLPKLHVTLYYLYFRAGTTLSRRIGADWATHTCNDDTEDLCKWLTDTTAHYPPSARDSKVTLLPRGYSGKHELSNTVGDIVGEEVSTIVDSEGSEGRLPYLLTALSFNTSFSRVSTAAALSFIDAFCKAVTSGGFNGDNGYQKISFQLSSICVALLVKLKPFTGGSHGHRLLESLFQDSESDLVGILRRDAYNSYVDWLKERLPMLCSYLYDMQKECSEWDPSSLYIDKAVGPFAYGFIFGRAWRRDGNYVYSVRSKLKTFIAKVTGECTSSNNDTLVALWKCFNHTSSSCPVPSLTSESHARNIEGGTAPTTSAVPAEENTATTPGQLHQEMQQPSQTSGGKSGVMGPPAPTQSHSVSSSSSGAETSAASSASQPAEHTPNGPETSGSSSRSQAGGPSGANSSAICSREPCPDHTQYGRSEGSSGTEVDSRMADQSITNAQSTITIGGATGGAAVIGGGCAALYYLNVGGIKTLITGVP